MTKTEYSIYQTRTHERIEIRELGITCWLRVIGVDSFQQFKGLYHIVYVKNNHTVDIADSA